MLQQLLDVVLHLDTHLSAWSASLGPWLYLVLFLIIFCETGLVVTPFLPGDSLLFAVGALSALPESGLNVFVVIVLLCVAAVVGDTVNYKIGDWIGVRAFRGEYRFINPKHLERTKDFYDRYGGRAIVIARFAPILRTFAPFVAGVGQMPYARFFAFNVGGGVAWVGAFIGAGYAFGNIPAVKKQFHIVIIAIIVISLIPAVIEAIRARSGGKPTAA
jgi:membrane-associated protein